MFINCPSLWGWAGWCSALHTFCKVFPLFLKEANYHEIALRFLMFYTDILLISLLICQWVCFLSSPQTWIYLLFFCCCSFPGLFQLLCFFCLAVLPCSLWLQQATLPAPKQQLLPMSLLTFAAALSDTVLLASMLGRVKRHEGLVARCGSRCLDEVGVSLPCAR